MRHDNIVDVIAFNVGDSNNPPLLIMERMEESLYEALSQDFTIDLPWALGIIKDVCMVRIGTTAGDTSVAATSIFVCVSLHVNFVPLGIVHISRDHRRA